MQGGRILNKEQAEPPEGWLVYIFQYVLHKSFPEAVTIVLKPEYEVLALIYLELLRTIIKYAQKNNWGKAFEHNIPLMSKLNDEATFTGMIEAARSERDWKNIRQNLL